MLERGVVEMVDTESMVPQGHLLRKVDRADEYYDCVLCPEYQPWAYSTTNRDGYREYKSDPKICANVQPGSYAPAPKTA